MRMAKCRALALSATVATMAACGEDSRNPLVAPPEPTASTQELTSVSAADVVTASLAMSLHDDGKFGPPDYLPGKDVVTPAMARTLALQYAREFLVLQDTRLEKEHGGDIDFTSLTAHPVVELAESPYGGGDVDLPGPVKRAVGDFYMVTLLSAGVPAISIGVSTISGHLSIRDEHLSTDGPHGNEFRSSGIPMGLASPEGAARAAASFGRGKVNARPRFIRTDARHYPQHGYWLVEVLPDDGTRRRDLMVSRTGAVKELGGELIGVDVLPLGRGEQVSLTRRDPRGLGGAR